MRDSVFPYNNRTQFNFSGVGKRGIFMFKGDIETCCLSKKPHSIREKETTEESLKF